MKKKTDYFLRVLLGREWAAQMFFFFQPITRKIIFNYCHDDSVFIAWDILTFVKCFNRVLRSASIEFLNDIPLIKVDGNKIALGGIYPFFVAGVAEGKRK